MSNMSIGGERVNVVILKLFLFFQLLAALATVNIMARAPPIYFDPEHQEEFFFEFATFDNFSTKATNLPTKEKTPVPVIGLLTEVLRDYKNFGDHWQTHLVSSYVKWVEAAGAKAMPIFLNQNESYYERVFRETNGLLFPGGDNLLDPSKNTPMMAAAKKLYKLAVEANDKGDHYPIWGTCLGLELLSVLTANKNALVDCSANDIVLSMEFVDRGRIFAPRSLPALEQVDYSEAIMKTVSTKNITYHYHHKCLTDQALQKIGLDKFYRPLSYSVDKEGLKFITVFEAIDYPFYATQFHPEKPPFEFESSSKQENVPHSAEAIALSRYFADFFISQAKLNEHKYSALEVRDSLIYAYNARYTAPLKDFYEQRYLFPFENNGNTSTEEFIEHFVGENEEAPEDLDDDEDENLNAPDVIDNEK